MLSAPFSVTENRSWRYRAISITVNICGPLSKEETIRKSLRGASSDLDDLVIGDDDGLREKRLRDSSSSYFFSTSTLPYATSTPLCVASSSLPLPSTSLCVASSLSTSSLPPLFPNNPPV